MLQSCLFVVFMLIGVGAFLKKGSRSAGAPFPDIGRSTQEAILRHDCCMVIAQQLRRAKVICIDNGHTSS